MKSVLSFYNQQYNFYLLLFFKVRTFQHKLKLDNKKQYKWSKKTGRLREINWYKKGLKGKINFNKLIELRYINVKRNNLKNIDINKLKNLDVLMCQKIT